MTKNLVHFPSVGNTRSPELQRKPQHSAGHPAAWALRADLVLRQARQTRNVVTVARRLGVRANDIFLVVLDALDERRVA